jgi:hypothetical protein
MRRALLVVAYLSGACGSKTDEPTGGSAVAPSGPTDACSLLPRERLEAAVGEVQGPLQVIAQKPPYLGMCRAKLAGDLQLTVSVRGRLDFDAMASSGTELKGIGEKAMLTQQGAMLRVAGSAQFFIVLVTGPSGIDESKTIEAAKVVAAAGQM